MWSYKVVLFDFEANGASAFDGLLAEMGQDRWELVTVSRAFEQLLLIFKKPSG